MSRVALIVYLLICTYISHIHSINLSASHNIEVIPLTGMMPRTDKTRTMSNPKNGVNSSIPSLLSASDNRDLASMSIAERSDACNLSSHGEPGAPGAAPCSSRENVSGPPDVPTNHSENSGNPSRYRILPPSSRNNKGGPPHFRSKPRGEKNDMGPPPKTKGNTQGVIPPHADPPGFPGFSEWLDFEPILLEEGEVVDLNLDLSDTSVESILVEPPSPEDIACISVSDLRHQYGQEVVTLFRKIQRLDFQGKKTILDKRYLSQCVEHGIYPKWLNVKIGNPNDRNQTKLILDFKVQTLKNEIGLKKRKTQACFVLRHKLTEDFKNRVSKGTADGWLDSIKESNSSRLERVGLNHFRKFTRLLLDNHKIDASVLTSEARHAEDPFNEGSLNVIFNQSSHVLSPLEEEGLRNGLKFILSPNKVDEVDLYARLESLVGTIYYREKNPPQLANIASEMGREAQNAIERFNHSKPTPNIRKSVLQALKGLANNKDLVINKPDKGNGVVIMDRTDYVSKVMDILGDPQKFRENPNVDLYKPTLSLETEVRFLLKELLKKGVIDIKQYRAAYPTGSRPCLLYGLPKVHKTGTPIRPILSAAGSAVHGLAQLMVPILAPITTNEHTVSNSLVFAEEMANLDKSGLTFASYDVASLFTNIPLEETVDIIAKANFDQKLSRDLDPHIIKKIIRTTTQNCFFRFDGKIFSQTDGVAMGSPLGPTLANIFMSDFESKHLGNCPEECRPVLYRRYVDDILVAFKRPEDIGAFWEYYNNLHPNIKFSIEEENGGIINFLDITIKKEGGTSTFRKNTFTGLLTKYNSFLHQQYKTGLISCLLYRSWKLCSSMAMFEEEISFLKTLFLQNRFPLDLFLEETSKFKSKHCATPEATQPTDLVTLDTTGTSSPSTSVVHDPDDPVVPAVPFAEQEEKNPMTIALPYLGDASLRLRNGIKKSLRRHLPDSKFRFVFRSGTPLSAMFKFKDQLAADLCSKLVYHYTCSTCHVDYIGCTNRHLRTRVSEHMGISARTGAARGTHPSDATAVKQHATDSGHPISEEDFKVIYNPSQPNLLYISETILIQRNKPSLNDTVGSYPLRVHPTNLGLESHLLARDPDLGNNSFAMSNAQRTRARRVADAGGGPSTSTPISPPRVYSATKRFMPVCTDLVRKAHGFPPLRNPNGVGTAVGATTHCHTTLTATDTAAQGASSNQVEVSVGLTPLAGSICPTHTISTPDGTTTASHISSQASSQATAGLESNAQVSGPTGRGRPYTSSASVACNVAVIPSIRISPPTPDNTSMPAPRSGAPGPSPESHQRDWANARDRPGVYLPLDAGRLAGGIATTPLLPRTARRRDWSTLRRSTRIASQGQQGNIR